MNPRKPIESLILTLRGQKVILDADLAELYGVPTKRLNEQVKRNADRFPEDFLFQLTALEFENLKSQIATSSLEVTQNEGVVPNWSQIAAGSHGGRRKFPHAFTEHGAIMAATVLNSPAAVAMSVFVVRAFLQMREQLAANAAILKRLAEIDRTLLDHDSALRTICVARTPPDSESGYRGVSNARTPRMLEALPIGNRRYSRLETCATAVLLASAAGPAAGTAQTPGGFSARGRKMTLSNPPMERRSPTRLVSRSAPPTRRGRTPAWHWRSALRKHHHLI